MKFVSVTGFFMAGLSLLSAVSLGGCKSREYNGDNSGAESVVDAQGNFLDLRVVAGRTDGAHEFFHCKYKNVKIEDGKFKGGSLVDGSCQPAFTAEGKNQAYVYPIKIDHPAAQRLLKVEGVSKIVGTFVGGVTVALVGAVVLRKGIGSIKGTDLAEAAEKTIGVVSGSSKAAGIAAAGAGGTLVGLGIVGPVVGNFVWGIGKGDMELGDADTFKAVFAVGGEPKAVRSVKDILGPLADVIDSSFEVNTKLSFE